MLKYFFVGISLFSLSLFSQDYILDDPVNTGINMTVAVLAVDKNISIGDTIVALYMMPIMDTKFHENINVAGREDVSPNLLGHTLLSYMDPKIWRNYKASDFFGNGGFTTWHGERLAIAIWGNDSTSDKKDGFANGETINYVLLKNKRYIPLEAKYRLGQNSWEPNGISIIDSLKMPDLSGLGKLGWSYNKGFFTCN